MAKHRGHGGYPADHAVYPLLGRITEHQDQAAKVREIGKANQKFMRRYEREEMWDEGNSGKKDS